MIPSLLQWLRKPIAKGTDGMDTTAIRAQIEQIESKRGVLLDLLERPDLGTLRIDVNQALEEMDDLIEEFKRTFPDSDGDG